MHWWDVYLHLKLDVIASTLLDNVKPQISIILPAQPCESMEDTGRRSQVPFVVCLK